MSAAGAPKRLKIQQMLRGLVKMYGEPKPLRLSRGAGLDTLIEAMLAQNTLFRTQGMGKFRDLLLAVSQSVAAASCTAAKQAPAPSSDDVSSNGSTRSLSAPLG